MRATGSFGQSTPRNFTSPLIPVTTEAPVVKARKGKRLAPPSVQTHEFLVELTAYGWAVSENNVRLGLYVNKDAAMNRVRIRVQSLKAQGSPWSLTVLGVEQPLYKGRYLPARR